MPWYEYSALWDSTPRPLVEVVLWHGLRRVRLIALVDSGADASSFDVSYADALGLARKDAITTSATGAGGNSFKCLQWPEARLELQFDNQRFPFEGSFIEFPAGADPVSLLGRKDFFQEYVIQFWDAAELMNIDVSPDFPRTVNLNADIDLR